MAQKRVKDMPREQQKAVFANIDEGDGKTYRRSYNEPKPSKPTTKNKNPSAIETRDFFVKHHNKDGEVSYDSLEKEFGKKGAYSLHERGIIYEPVHGTARMTFDDSFDEPEKHVEKPSSKDAPDRFSIVEKKKGLYNVVDNKTGKVEFETTDINDAVFAISKLEKDHKYKKSSDSLKSENTIYTRQTQQEAKAMSKPKYSSIDWWDAPQGKLKTNEEHTIAKGTFKEISNEMIYTETQNVREPVKVKVKDEGLYPGDKTSNLKIGESYYSKRYLYEVSEEITGKKILRKDGSRPVKAMVGKEIILHTHQCDKSLFPIIVEGNNGYYAIAPTIEEDY